MTCSGEWKSDSEYVLLRDPCQSNIATSGVLSTAVFWTASDLRRFTFLFRQDCLLSSFQHVHLQEHRASESDLRNASTINTFNI